MIKNFSYTIPTVGRISIGEKTERNGQRLPSRLNHFLITAQHKRNGQWIEHPMMDAIAKETGQNKDQITEIPVCLMFNDPDLSLRSRYEAFDDNGRMLCAGDGCNARRLIAGKIESVTCPGKDHCEFARTARCKLMTRLNVQINIDLKDSKGASIAVDPMSSFILRSAGVNTARTLQSKLKYMSAILGGRLVGVPFTLKLRQKSSVQSHQSIFYYADLVPAVDLVEAARLASEVAQRLQEAGLDQPAFEAAVKSGLDNGPFEDTLDDLAEYEDYLGDDFRTAGADACTEALGTVAGQDQIEDDLNSGLDALRELVARKAA